jgi:hyperosmotically inducible protein
MPFAPDKKKQLIRSFQRLKSAKNFTGSRQASHEVTHMKKRLFAAVPLFVAMTIFSMVAFAGPAIQDNQMTGALPQKSFDRIVKEVRHELVMLPYYGVFDNLAYKVDPDGTVTLLGQVARPTLKSDSENVVKRIEGVTKVVNNIEVLPTSPDDDRIRRDTYRAIYGDPALSLYQVRAVPPIHIIVKNGHITLEGSVAREMDKTIAGMRANSVPGAFSVDNNLVVDEPEKGKKK